MEKGLIVDKTNNGKGILATKNFLKGRVYSAKHVYKTGGKFADNTFRFGPESYLSPTGYIGDFLNHSCKPNVGLRKRNNKLFLISLRNIKSGEEIFLDYSTIIGDDDIWKMKCKCGSKDCRGVIKNFGSLAENLQEAYIKQNIVPKYILNV
jgi:hypothetical protein